MHEPSELFLSSEHVGALVSPNGILLLYEKLLQIIPQFVHVSPSSVSCSSLPHSKHIFVSIAKASSVSLVACVRRKVRLMFSI